MDESRRQVLRMGAGLASAGAMTGLAGCSQVPFLGGGGGGGPAFYKNWMYAPGTFVDDQEHYGFTAYRPSNWAANEDKFDESTYENTKSTVESSLSMTGIDFGDINRYINLAGGVATIVKGSYNTEDVIGELDDAEGWEEQTQLDSGYTVYVNGSARSAVGVSGSAIIKLNRLPQSGGGSEGFQIEAPAEGEAQQDARSISYGETITGTIDESDPSGRRGNYEPITFTGSEGDVVRVTMVSGDDTYLQLLDPEGEQVAANDDFRGLDSRISRYTLQSSGEYTIVATSYSSSSTFPYRLRLELLFSPSVFPERISTIAGTQSGDTELYTSAVDPASALFSTLGGGDFVAGRTMEAVDQGAPDQGRFENMVGKGRSFVVNGEKSNVRGVVVYEEADDYDKDNIEEWTNAAQFWEDVDNISISQSGAAAVITGQIDTGDIGN